MYRKLSIVGFMFMSSLAHGQNCPAGIPSAGNPMCIPPDRENSPYYQGARTPQLSWKDRWGAIASNSLSGTIGTASGLRTRKLAEREAMLECKKKSARDCTIEISYFNQCAAMVIGETTYTTARAETKSSAIDIGMKSCFEENTDCHAYYADCSLPELTE